MTDEFIAEMKTALESEHADVQKELDAVSTDDKGDHVPGGRAPQFPNYGDDNLGENTESPAEVAQYMENVNATGMLEEKRQSVEAALARIAAGQYGACTSCGKEVGEERLRANPAAAQCIDCAQTHTV